MSHRTRGNGGIPELCRSRGSLLRQLLDKPLFRILGLHPSRFSDYCSHETDPRL